MIDLDSSLAALVGADEDPAQWSEPRAVTIAQKTAETLGLGIQYERGDEEWAIWFEQGGPYVGMISVRFPLAIVTEVVAPTLRDHEPGVRLEMIEDFLGEELRGSQDLLRRTVLRWGWNYDFDTEAFSANDLFVESV